MRTVLLVDCLPDERDMYDEFLRYNGFDPVVTCGAQAAYAQASSIRAAVAVVDVSAAQTGGLELIGRLRRDRRTRGMGIIVLSSRVFPHERALAANAGGDVFLPKPCLPETLLGEIRRFSDPNRAAAAEHLT